MWPFGRRGLKAVKFKEKLAADERAAEALRIRRQKRRRRTTASLHDGEKGPLFEKPSVHRRSTSVENSGDITALPLAKHLEQSPHLRPVTNEHGIPYNFYHPSALPHTQFDPQPNHRGRLQRPHSLRKPPASDGTFLGRRSSKRKAHDSVREEEIRAMSLPMPQKRPAGNSHGMLRRDSKKVKGALNRHFERPTSNISLPMEDSIHSSMSSGSETRAFRVSALDMFSPRPKIRCSVSSQYYGAITNTSPVSHNKYDMERDQRESASRDRSRRSSRIDDLADTLDAGALREILERDKRRKEKKRKAEEERLRRRLERRAEKQRALEHGAAPSSPRKEASRAIGLGIEKVVSTPMEDVRPSTPQQPKIQQSPHFEAPVTPRRVGELSQLPTPVESPVDEPVVSSAKAIRYSRASMSPRPQGHTRGPSNVSELPALLSEMVAREAAIQKVESVHDPNASESLHPVDTIDTAITSKRGSSRRRRSSASGRIAAFASFFRRRRRGSQDPGRTTPSEISFSNTSRESMSRQPLPVHLVAPLAPPTQPITIKRPSSVPRRTMSKFREDLPEYPMSPPDSRVQSPELAATSASAVAARRRSRAPSDVHTSLTSSGGDARSDSPVSPGVPPTGLMSQSLASVDSEGSWLSGKPLNRRSNKSHLRSSVGSSMALKRNEEFNNSYEELGMADDEYFKRLTAQPDDRHGPAQSGDLLGRKASSTAMAAAADTPPDIDEEILPTTETTPEEELVQNSVGRQPTIVHRQPRVKSTEGLLSYFQAEKASLEDEDDRAPPTPGEELAGADSPTSDTEPVMVQRARSVDLGKHHSRQLSAGSAKLLDIPARKSSVDPKRSSLSSQNTLSQQ